MAYDALNRIIQRSLTPKIPRSKGDPTSSQNGRMALTRQTKKAHLTKKCRYILLKTNKLTLQQRLLNKLGHPSNIPLRIR